MADVFISYASADRAAAQELAKDLESKGVTVWWDNQIHAGQDLHDIILAALDKAKAVIVLWSRAAVASRWVRGEADHAARTNKLICLGLPGFAVEDLPLNFRSLRMDDALDRSRVWQALEGHSVTVTDVNKSSEVEVLLKSADEYHMVGDYRYAISDYERAIRLDPRCAPAYRGLASVLAEMGDVSAAAALYSQAIEADGTESEDYLWRADAFAELGQHEAAIRDLTNVIAMTHEAAVYYQRGTMRERTGDIEQALGDYTEAIERGQMGLAYYRRGCILERLGQLRSAHSDFQAGSKLLTTERVEHARALEGMARLKKAM